MKDLYYGFKAIDQFAIPIAICLELLGLVLKHVEEVVSRVTVLKISGVGIRDKIDSGLFGIVVQGGVENRLEVRR
jgi:hypothetical protein